MPEYTTNIETNRRLFEQLVVSFGNRRQPRFTQDSKVRTDVWLAFADNPARAVSLIAIPDARSITSECVKAIAENLASSAGKRRDKCNEVLLMALAVEISISVDFYDFLRCVLPQTRWWIKDVSKNAVNFKKEVREAWQQESLDALARTFKVSREKAMWRFFAIAGLVSYGGALYRESSTGTYSDGERADEVKRRLHVEHWQRMGKMSRLLMAVGDPDSSVILEDSQREDLWNYLTHAFRFLEGLIPDDEGQGNPTRTRPDSKAQIYSVNLSRQTELAVERSRRTVKVDAAVQVFQDNSKDIVWAVVDSGVDPLHVAFHRLRSDGKANGESRVKISYDFNRLKSIFAGEYEKLAHAGLRAEVEREFPTPSAETTRQRHARMKKRHDYILGSLYAVFASERRAGEHAKLQDLSDDPDRRNELRNYLEKVRKEIASGRMVDWGLIEPLLIVRDKEEYRRNLSAHGTHVAGILMGRIEPDGEAHEADRDAMTGICPQMEIYDFRVTDKEGQGDEFVTIAALQFLSHLNNNRDKLHIHGVNLSLSFKHNVRNYASGRTPICMECERLVSSGVVVVAAAGNHGYQQVLTERGMLDAYNDISITDPGNAESVITVGATHREHPHRFGVSYFSSRGPTGDGRSKPDIVAPGESIVSSVPRLDDNAPLVEEMDGTSMAAPHVSGAAAHLMGRYTELMGRPDRIKEILCASATDLGRKREFQGAGLVDLLRALQSV